MDSGTTERDTKTLDPNRINAKSTDSHWLVDTVVWSSVDSSTYMQNHNDTIIKQTQEDFFNKIYTSHFIGTFVGERELETEQKCNILTPTLMAVSVVSFSFSRWSTGGPEAQLSAGWWLSLLHLITNWSGPQTPSGYPRTPSAGCGFPYHISFITLLISNCLISVLTELYNNTTSTQSPTRSFESHVWSSSSGNNCHAVHRWLSSGASV